WPLDQNPPGALRPPILSRNVRSCCANNFDLRYVFHKAGSLAAHFHVQTQTLHFLDKDVERLGCPGFEGIIAFNDGFVDASAALNVIGLDCQQLLQGVSGAVGFERPHLHLAKTLSAILCLAAQWLLGHERIGSDGARVDFIRHQMAQLHHVDVADHYFLIERFAGAPIVKPGFAVFLYPTESFLLSGFAQILANSVFLDAGEHRGGDLETESLGGDTEVSFQNLADIHAAGNAQRIEHDLHRRAVGEEGHVLLGYDPSHDAFVAVAAGHFIANAQFAFAGNIDLDLLDNAGVNVVAAFDAIDGPVAFQFQFGKLVLV